MFQNKTLNYLNSLISILHSPNPLTLPVPLKDNGQETLFKSILYSSIL